MAIVKREQVEKKFLKVYITLESREEFRAVTAALGRMSTTEYELESGNQGWTDDPHKLDKAGSDIYHMLAGFMSEVRKKYN